MILYQGVLALIVGLTSSPVSLVGDGPSQTLRATGLVRRGGTGDQASAEVNPHPEAARVRQQRRNHPDDGIVRHGRGGIPPR